MAQMNHKSGYSETIITTDGSLALKAKLQDSALALEQAGLYGNTAAAPYVRPKERVAVQEQTKVKAKIPVLSVVGFAVAAIMMVAVLVSYIELTQVSHSVVSLEKEIAALQEEEMRLNTRYELTFDFATIKQAAEDAGMQKVTSSQIYYIDMAEGDSAVVYQEATTGIEKLLNTVKNGIVAVVEFFR